MEIREERRTDVSSVRDVNTRAFGRDREARIVDALRSSGAALLSLVAEQEGAVVGHIMYSQASIGDVKGAALGPMAVVPEQQRHGIGSDLVANGTQRLRRASCPFIVVLGHPSFYPRFGFRRASSYGISCEWAVPEEAFMVLVLNEIQMRSVKGVAAYRPEFSTVD
jgi:putative acetyltransferase